MAKKLIIFFSSLFLIISFSLLTGCEEGIITGSFVKDGSTCLNQCTENCGNNTGCLNDCLLRECHLEKKQDGLNQVTSHSIFIENLK